ncbi:MAG: type II secretion system F family protein, partial [Eggerthellaceae bacterium]|nr:type II secretion system F family protein [Eggerthellaceae bacterium]
LRRTHGLESTDDILPTKEPRANSLETRIVNEMVFATHRINSGASRSLLGTHLKASTWLEPRLSPAGLKGFVSSAGFWNTRVKCALACSLIGLALGLSLSAQLALALSIAGIACGWELPKRVIKSRIKLRADQMERHLAEMLDVVSLGLRSGLSFERSILLYTQHFETSLAQSFKKAYQQWSCGLITREEALRQVVVSYDSSVMSRVIEDMIRSLRFGSSLADNLELAAEEVRADYRSRKEEQVAKAPVKMMLPTGTLILPAMLILVLGPVLLELMKGF